MIYLFPIDVASVDRGTMRSP